MSKEQRNLIREAVEAAIADECPACDGTGFGEDSGGMGGRESCRVCDGSGLAVHKEET